MDHKAELQLIIAGKPSFIKEEYLALFDKLAEAEEVDESEFWMYLAANSPLSYTEARIAMGYWQETRGYPER